MWRGDFSTRGTIDSQVEHIGLTIGNYDCSMGTEGVGRNQLPWSIVGTMENK